MTGWHLTWARLLLTAALSPSALAGGGDYDVLAWAAPAAAALAVAALAVVALAVAALMPSELNRAVLDTCCAASESPYSASTFSQPGVKRIEFALSLF